MSANTASSSPTSGQEIHIPTLALTREQAAKALNTSPATIDRLTKRGLLKPSRATRRPLYSVEAITQFLRETTAEIPAEEAR
jgi:MerR HTH family regulatory protein